MMERRGYNGGVVFARNEYLKRRQYRAEGMLVVATFFWGWTFPVIKDAITILPVFAFLTWRFAIAGALMFALHPVKIDAPTLKTGLLLGVFLYLAFAFQTLGLAETTATKSAFITGLNLVWVAVIAARHWRTWVAVALAAASLYLISDVDDIGDINRGDALTLVCSLMVAIHILLLARLPRKSDSAALSMIQFVTVAVLSLASSLLFEERLLPPQWDNSLIFALLITVLGATIFSFWAQTHYERFTTPTRAAIIFILEPVFAAIISVLWYDEVLSPNIALGATLILIAMALAARAK